MPHRDPLEPVRAPRAMPPNSPHYTLGAAVLLVIVGVAAAVLTRDQRNLSILLGLIVTTVPGLIAAGYAERASRDIRNGTVTEKARQGTVKALTETGVTDVVEAAGRGQASVLAMESLALLLEDARKAQARDRPRNDPGTYGDDGVDVTKP